MAMVFGTPGYIIVGLRIEIKFAKIAYRGTKW
jgi:hypothetical protein